MARLDPYLSAEQFKARIGLQTEDQDEAIEAVVLAASRSVDGWTGRAPGGFNTDASEIRYYEVRGCEGHDIWVDEFTAVTELAVDDGSATWAEVIDPGDYRPGPANAPIGGEPYGYLRTISVLRRGPDQIKVVGTFGWPAVPAPIVEATFLLANRMRSSWTAPFGVAGQGDLGQLQTIVDLTPPIQRLLSPYRVMAY